MNWMYYERQRVVENEFGGSGWHQTWMSNECELNIWWISNEGKVRIEISNERQIVFEAKLECLTNVNWPYKDYPTRVK